MVRISGPKSIGPGFVGRAAGAISRGFFVKRLTNLAGRLPQLGAVLDRGIRTLASPPKIQHFLRTGRSAFETLLKKYGLNDPGPLPTLPFQPPGKIRIMLPTYPPRYIEVRPQLPPKLEDSIRQKRPILDDLKFFPKIEDEVLRKLQKRHPTGPFGTREGLAPFIRDFITELGRHASPMETGVPSIPGSELHRHGPFLADVPGARPKPDIDMQGPLLAAATSPSTVSGVTGTPATVQPLSASVGEQIYGKADDWWKDPSNWPHAVSAMLGLPYPANWKFGHVVTTVRALKELQQGNPKSIDIASKVLNVLEYLLPSPFRQVLGSATSFLNIFKGVELADMYRDVSAIAKKINEYRNQGIEDPKEIVQRLQEDLLDPDVGMWQIYGNLRGEDPRVRLVRALTVYILATGDENLTGIPQR